MCIVHTAQRETSLVPGHVVRAEGIRSRGRCPSGSHSPARLWGPLAVRFQVAGPALASLGALVGRLPSLCEGSMGVGPEVPVASGTGLPRRVTDLSQFAEDFPGLRAPSPMSWEPPGQMRTVGHLAATSPLAIAQSRRLSPAPPPHSWDFAFLCLSLHPLLPAPSLSPGVSLSLPLTTGSLPPCSFLFPRCWGSLALLSPGLSPCWFLGLSLHSCSVHFHIAPVCLWRLTPSVFPFLSQSLAHHLPWVVWASPLSPGTHPQA